MKIFACILTIFFFALSVQVSSAQVAAAPLLADPQVTSTPKPTATPAPTGAKVTPGATIAPTKGPTTPTPTSSLVTPTPVQSKTTPTPTPQVVGQSAEDIPTPTPTLKPLPLTNVIKPDEPIGRILTAPFNAVMNTLPTNYYMDQGLAARTNELLLGIGFLFITAGATLLSWPSLVKAKRGLFTRLQKEKPAFPYVAGESNKQFV